jgi:hypothetical protein
MARSRKRTRDPKEGAIARAIRLVRSLAERLRSSHAEQASEPSARHVLFLGFAGFGRVSQEIADH